MVFRFCFLFLAMVFATPRINAEGNDWIARCGQIVLVVAEDWESTTGTLRRVEKRDGRWSAAEPVPVTLGHRGLGLGVGLHPASLQGPQKQEGDQRAPAGIFALESGFGTKALELKSFPYRQTTEADRWIDDPESSLYNQWVQLGDPAIKADWRSAEVLRRKDGLYDFAIVVGHNRGRVEKGRGSAIFMHVWSAPGRSTIGCTAMEKKQVRDLLEWLDAGKVPVLVQAPRALLPSLGLPDEILAILDAPAASRR